LTFRGKDMGATASRRRGKLHATNLESGHGPFIGRDLKPGQTVKRESSGLAPVARLIDAGYYDLELKLSEHRDQIEFRVHHRPEQLGRYLKQQSRVFSRMLRAIRSAGFTRVGFEELGLEYKDDVVEGGFWVRPIAEVFAEHPDGADEDDDDHKWWE
jgi:hypothetical protein